MGLSNKSNRVIHSPLTLNRVDKNIKAMIKLSCPDEFSDLNGRQDNN